MWVETCSLGHSDVTKSSLSNKNTVCAPAEGAGPSTSLLLSVLLLSGSGSYSKKIKMYFNFPIHATALLKMLSVNLKEGEQNILWRLSIIYI
jgi:hypothetical protein